MLDQARAYNLTFHFPRGDTTVGPALRDYGEFSRVVARFLVDEAVGSGAMIDVGANIGAICLPLANLRRQWRVLAIEAHGGLAEILSKNVQANGLTNVEVLHAAAGAEAGTAEFPDPPLDDVRNFGNIGFGMPAEATHPVPMVALDDVAPADTRLVKIDVEGFEPEVLRGASRLLAARNTVWLVEASVQHPEASAETIRVLQDFGYTVHWFYAPFVTPICRGGPPPEPALGDANVVALPPGAPNRWNLTPVVHPNEPRPLAQAAYPYMADYGYVPKVRTAPQ